jgi:hypothetical protein
MSHLTTLNPKIIINRIWTLECDRRLEENSAENKSLINVIDGTQTLVKPPCTLPVLWLRNFKSKIK